MLNLQKWSYWIIFWTKISEKIFEIDVASFPVGMALSPDESKLIVTSQGKSSTPGSGNTVTVFDVNYN